MDTELLEQFTRKRLIGTLARLQLPAGKFPQPALMDVRRPTLDQDAPFVVGHGGCRDMDPAAWRLGRSHPHDGLRSGIPH
jgi:hypothetical protein